MKKHKEVNSMIEKGSNPPWLEDSMTELTDDIALNGLRLESCPPEYI